MTRQRHEQLVNALYGWAIESEDPDRPVLEFGSIMPLELMTESASQSISARQIYNEVDEGTELGKWFEEIVEAGAQRTSFAEVLAGFEVARLAKSA